MFKDRLQQALTTQMDRKGFLKFIGLVILSLLGVTALLRIVLSHEVGSSSANDELPSGYGVGRK